MALNWNIRGKGAAVSSSTSQSLTIIDGLIVSRWSRSVFEHMHRGGLTAANCTCSVWENFEQTMKKVAQWKTWLEEYSDILMQVYSVADIHAAKKSGKVGIILGWQNTSAIEDQIPYLRLFSELGVKVVQLTYNTQNLSGSGCYESRDGGLSDFGREVIDEMNRLRMLIDLSHVGQKTAEDAIGYSKQPVCYSHVAPKALKDHPRCKSDEQLQRIARRGGFIGATPFTPFMRRGPDSTIDDFLEVIEHIIQIAGENQVGIGTDFSQDSPETPEYWMNDKGYARKLTEFGEIKYPDGFELLSDYPNLVPAMERRGWSEGRIRRVMGENWLTFLGEVWGT